MKKVKKVNLRLHWWLPGSIKFRIDPGENLALFILDKAKSKNFFKIDCGDIIVKSPQFKSEKKVFSWVKNNLPRRKLEKFLTASQKKAVKIEKILL